MKKKVVRRVALITVMACLLLSPVLIVGAQTVSAAQAPPEQTQAAGVEAAGVQPGMSHGKQMMQWGVLLFAVGEFAGLLGMGVCSMRRARRSERKAEKPVAQSMPLLLYAEHKAAQPGAEAKAPARIGFGLTAFGGVA